MTLKANSMKMMLGNRKVDLTEVAKNVVPIHESVAVNFGLEYDAIPAAAMDLLGLAVDTMSKEEESSFSLPGYMKDQHIIDKDLNNYMSAKAYARLDAVGLSTSSVQNLRLQGESRTLIPDAMEMHYLTSDDSEIVWMQQSKSIGCKKPDCKPYVSMKPIWKLNLREEHKDMFDKESLYPHSHYVSAVIIGIRHLAEEKDNQGREDRDDDGFQHQIESSTLNDYSVLWCEFRSTDAVKQQFFAQKISGPVCVKGHLMFFMKLSELQWVKPMVCKSCSEPTDYGLQTCKRRCELSGICMECHQAASQVSKVGSKSVILSQLPNARPLAEGTDNCIPCLMEGETCLALRFGIVCDISIMTYYNDPYAYDEKTIMELAELTNTYPRQFAITNALPIDDSEEEILFEISMVYPTISLTETRHFYNFSAFRTYRPPCPVGGRKTVAMPLIPNPSEKETHWPKKTYDLPGVFKLLYEKFKNPMCPSEYPQLGRTISRFLVLGKFCNMIVTKCDIPTMVHVPEDQSYELREMLCTMCEEESVEDCELSNHKKNFCSMRYVPCDLECGQYFVFRELEDHLSFDCPERGIVCACNKAVIAKLHQEHLAAGCPAQPWTCPQCKLKMLHADIEKHSSQECDSRTSVCNWCNKEMLWKKLKPHKFNECEQRVEKAIMLKSAVWRNEVEDVDMLLQDGANPNAFCPVAARPLGPVTAAGKLPDDSALGGCLHAAGAVDACAEIMRLLLDYNADFLQRDFYGIQPLQIAAMHGSRAACDVLIERKADPNGQDLNGRSAVFNAAFHYQRNCIDLLTDPKMEQINPEQNVYRGIREILETTDGAVRHSKIYERDLDEIQRVTKYEVLIQPIRDYCEDS